MNPYVLVGLLAGVGALVWFATSRVGWLKDALGDAVERAARAEQREAAAEVQLEIERAHAEVERAIIEADAAGDVAALRELARGMLPGTRARPPADEQAHQA